MLYSVMMHSLTHHTQDQIMIKAIIGAANMKKSVSNLAVAAENSMGITITVTNGRAAYYAEEVGAGYWLTRDDLAYAIDCAREHGSDAYSHWCNGTGKPMSARSARRIFGMNN